MIEGRRIATRLVNDALVKKVRLAETTPGTTRIVFDLASPVEFKVTRLDTPDRIVIELTPGGSKQQVSKERGNVVAASNGCDAVPESFGSARRGPCASDKLRSPATTASVAAAPRTAEIPMPPVGEVTSSAPKPSPAAMPATSPAAAPVMVTRMRAPERKFVPPALPRHMRPLLPVPNPTAALEIASLGPSPLQPGWFPSLNARLPGKPEAFFTSGGFTPPPFVNTTTRVLPAVRPSQAISPVKATTGASVSLTRALGLKINRVVIDAGHGGRDEGTVGPNRVLEKNVVLDVALRLAKLVQTGLGAEVVLTRSDDTYVPLTERTAIANEYKADLFLSIHANSSPLRTVAGTETFLLSLKSSTGDLSVAARENAGSDKSVGELQDMLQSIALNDKIAESQSFAADIQSSIFAQAAKLNTGARDRGIKKAPFVVLIGARMPSVLAEIGFLSNSRDESNLNKPEYRQKIAESLYKGIQRYSLSLSHYELAAAK